MSTPQTTKVSTLPYMYELEPQASNKTAVSDKPNNTGHAAAHVINNNKAPTRSNKATSSHKQNAATTRTGHNLTPKQKAFADAILDNPTITGAQAVIQAGYDVTTENSARVLASENLTKHNIQLYLANHLEEAERVMIELMRLSKDYATDGGKEGAAYATVALNASKDIQDRIKGKAVQQIEQRSTKLVISIDMTQ
jgi:hypothetical protein